MKPAMLVRLIIASLTGVVVWASDKEAVGVSVDTPRLYQPPPLTGPIVYLGAAVMAYVTVAAWQHGKSWQRSTTVEPSAYKPIRRLIELVVLTVLVWLLCIGGKALMDFNNGQPVPHF